MPPRLARILLRILRVVGLDAAADLSRGALADYGYTRSYRAGVPVKADGAPLPWYTYGAIDFLERRLSPTTTVFEYGAGFSTLWYADRVERVVGVESDPDWAARIAPRLPANAAITVETQLERYQRAILSLAEPFDVVVIDGLSRPECAAIALERLAHTGVFVWDNSDRAEFQETMSRVLAPLGFRHIPFSGLVPTSREIGETSVVYRPDNCLGI
jgi:hypothetical protein